jgi:hypothetical protein
VGHPLVDALLDHFRAPMFAGLTSVRRVDGTKNGYTSVVQFNYIVRQHSPTGIRESLKIIPVINGREYAPELAPILTRRVGRSDRASARPPAEAKQVADSAIAMLLAQEAAADPKVPHEYEMDGVALVVDSSPETPEPQERGRDKNRNT